MRSLIAAVWNVDACAFARRNASSRERGAGVCACSVDRQRNANSTARGNAFGLARFVIYGGEYSRANLNGRLIDGGESVANVEHVAFAAARVKQFQRVFSVDLLAQAIHV